MPWALKYGFSRRNWKKPRDGNDLTVDAQAEYLRLFHDRLNMFRE